jgi:hypothetical protein
MRAVKKLENSNDGMIGARQFLDFSKQSPVSIKPLFDVQNQLRERILGLFMGPPHHYICCLFIVSSSSQSVCLAVE